MVALLVAPVRYARKADVTHVVDSPMG